MNPAPLPTLRAARAGWIPPTSGVFGIALLLAAGAIHVGAAARRHPPPREVVTVPFDLAMGTVIVEAVINGSRPLSFRARQRRQRGDRAYGGCPGARTRADRAFRIIDVLEDSPASGAGLRIDDVIVALDDVPADRLTLATITEMLEQPRRYAVRIRRGDQTIDTEITPARVI